MADSKFLVRNFEFRFTDADVVNDCNFIPLGDYNPHKVVPWLLHDEGFTICVVFADCENDALDEAADEGKLDRYLLDDAAAEEAEKKNIPVSFLGNYGKPYDVENLGIMQLPTPSFSFCSLFNNEQKN